MIGMGWPMKFRQGKAKGHQEARLERARDGALYTREAGTQVTKTKAAPVHSTKPAMGSCSSAGYLITPVFVIPLMEPETEMAWKCRALMPWSG